MVNLRKHPAKICYTAAGFLIHEEKVLLIKHKKLGIWLVPGGHIDEGELPHEAAEREFWEETGITVQAIDPFFDVDKKTDTQYFPSPIVTNLHWVSEENFQNRVKSDDPKKRVKTALWPKGCEQHVSFLYLVEPVDGVKFKQNTEETDGIGWFTIDEVDDLETTDDIRMETWHVFKLLESFDPIEITV